MKKDKKLTTLVKFFAGLLIVLGVTTWFPSLFTLIEGREVNVKYNGTGSVANNFNININP